jgi:hypothetical protein
LYVHHSLNKNYGPVLSVNVAFPSRKHKELHMHKDKRMQVCIQGEKGFVKNPDKGWRHGSSGRNSMW